MSFIISSNFFLILILIALSIFSIDGYAFTSNRISILNNRNMFRSKQSSNTHVSVRNSARSELKMNFFGDAVRFFTNLNKEASAKHILMTGPDASQKLQLLKEELSLSSDVSTAFSELASKVSECPSAKRGGNLGTFKPGMMVREIDSICFEKDVGVVHGPIQTQFGSHLVLVTRRFEGEKK